MSQTVVKARLTPPGTALEFSPEEERILPANVLREYRRFEELEIQRFKGTWGPKTDEIDLGYLQAREVYYGEVLDTNKAKELEELTATYKKNYIQNQNDKATAWGKVVRTLENGKDRVFASFLSDVKAQTLAAEDYRIPEGGRWISFPIWNTEENNNDSLNGEPQVISWIASNTTFKCKYYKTTCWFGALQYDQIPVPSTEGVAGKQEQWTSSASLTPFGETELYIAAEFIEPRYQGAPHLRGLHLKDNFPVGTKWAYIRLDHTFHYGQDSSKAPTHRYLVYHPFIKTRKIPQNVFADNVLATTAKAMSTAAGGARNEYIAAAGAAAGVITDLTIQISADPLRQFPPLKNQQVLYSHSMDIKKLEVKWNEENSSLSTHIAQAQSGMVLALTTKKVADVLKQAAFNEAQATTEELPTVKGDAALVVIDASNVLKAVKDDASVDDNAASNSPNFVYADQNPKLRPRDLDDRAGKFKYMKQTRATEDPQKQQLISPRRPELKKPEGSKADLTKGTKGTQILIRNGTAMSRSGIKGP